MFIFICSFEKILKKPQLFTQIKETKIVDLLIVLFNHIDIYPLCLCVCVCWLT